MDSGGNAETEDTVEPTPEHADVDASEKVETPQIETAEKTEAIVENIEKPVEIETPIPPIRLKRALICIGEYPVKILLNRTLLNQNEDVLPIFIDKSGEEIMQFSKGTLDPDSIVAFDAEIDTHFWFNVLSHLGQNDHFVSRLKEKPMDSKHGAVVVASTWDGVGSALLPMLISQLKDWNTSSIALALLPSKLQPSDAHLNALYCLGKCASKDFSTVVLIERDQLNTQVGVNRNGSTVKGNAFLNYALELMMAKETFVQELTELSRAFNVRFFTILAATGASLKIYGSLENILDTALLRPLLNFNLSSATLLYVFPRLPFAAKEKLSKDKIELTVANWFKEKANLKSIVVAEPVYVDELNDRVDFILFVGGFDRTAMVNAMEKKANAMKASMIKNGSIKEEEWKAIVSSLTTD